MPGSLMTVALMAALAWAQDRPRPIDGKLKPGDPAPDFTLKRLHSAAEVTLSSFRGKPVALVFGSYT